MGGGEEIVLMDTEHFRSWYSKRVKIAEEIVTNHGPEGEADAEILLCCSISALAAQMWPGEGIDKKRFVQFLVQFSDERLCVRKISIPLLEKNLEKSDFNTAIRVRRKFLPGMPIMLDGDADKDETEVMAMFPSLSRKEIRNSSRASSIYVDLRSGLVHEYQLSSHLVSYTFSDRKDIPSYVNRQDNVPDLTAGTFVTGETRRYLHFPYPYIRKISDTAAQAAFGYWEKQNSWDQAEPQSWWVEG